MRDNPFIERLKNLAGADFVTEFDESLAEMSGNFEQLYTQIEDNMTRYSFIGGVSLISVTGSIPFLISKNSNIADDYKKVKDVVANLQPEIFFSSLSEEIEKDGLGHLKFEYFDIFFATLTQNFAISFFVIDEHKKKIEILNQLSEEVRVSFQQSPEDLAKNELDDKQGQKYIETSPDTGKVPQPAPSPSPSPAPSPPPMSNSATAPSTDDETEETRNKSDTEIENQKDPNNDKKPKTKEDLKSSLKGKLSELSDN